MQVFATIAVDVGGEHVVLDHVELVYDARIPHATLVVNDETLDRLGLIKTRLDSYREPGKTESTEE